MRYKSKRDNCIIDNCPEKTNINKKTVGFNKDLCIKHTKEEYKKTIPDDKKLCSLYEKQCCINLLNINDTYNRCEECRKKLNTPKSQKCIIENCDKHNNYITKSPFYSKELCLDHSRKDYISKIDHNKKICSNYIIRVCTNLLDKNSEYAQCNECRNLNKISDKKRHEKKRQKRIELNTEVLNKENKTFDDNLLCSCCKVQNNIIHFLENPDDIKSTVFTICLKCRKNQQDRNNNEYRKIYSQELEQKKESKLTRYKYKAKNRNIKFELTDDEFYNLINQNCHYCGEKNITKPYNGVDRVNSYEDYTKENSVSCCSACNYFKNGFKKDIFIDIINNIINSLEFNKKPKNINYKNCKIDYAQYLKSAHQRYIQFRLSNDLFEYLILQNCYLCNSNINIGIDRINSSKDYTSNNVISCCNNCNLLKIDFTLKHFITKISKIYIKVNNKVIDINKLLEKINIKIEEFQNKININLYKDYNDQDIDISNEKKYKLLTDELIRAKIRDDLESINLLSEEIKKYNIPKKNKYNNDKYNSILNNNANNIINNNNNNIDDIYDIEDIDDIYDNIKN